MQIIAYSFLFLMLTACGTTPNSKPTSTETAEVKPEATPVAFGGVCPMGLCKKIKKMGSSDHQTTIKGQTYHFSSAEAKELFLKDPEKNIKMAHENWAQFSGDRIK